MKVKQVQNKILICIMLAVMIISLIACTKDISIDIPDNELSVLTSEIIPREIGDIRVMSANVLVRIKS